MPGITSFWKSAAIWSKGCPVVGAVADVSRVVGCGVVVSAVAQLTRQLLDQVPRLDLGLDIAVREVLVVVADLVDGGVACTQKVTGAELVELRQGEATVIGASESDGPE